MNNSKSSCIEQIYCVDSDNENIIINRLASFIHNVELAAIKSEYDYSLLTNKKYCDVKRIPNDLFVKIDKI